MKKIQSINIIYLTLLLLTVILIKSGFTSFQASTDYPLLYSLDNLVDNEFQIEKFIAQAQPLDIQNTVSTLNSKINCPKKIGFNGLSWECNQSDNNMGLVVTDNNGIVLMSDYINLDYHNFEQNRRKGMLNLVEPHEFNRAYILLTKSRPLTIINSQTSPESIYIDSEEIPDLTGLLLSTPNIKDILTLTTFEKELTFTADVKGGFNPTNISKFNSWEFAQADWDKIVNSSFNYVYFDNGGLICNQKYLGIQENSAAKLLCNEIVAVD